MIFNLPDGSVFQSARFAAPDGDLTLLRLLDSGASMAVRAEDLQMRAVEALVRPGASIEDRTAAATVMVMCEHAYRQPLQGLDTA